MLDGRTFALPGSASGIGRYEHVRCRALSHAAIHSPERAAGKAGPDSLDEDLQREASKVKGMERVLTDRTVKRQEKFECPTGQRSRR